MEGGLPYVSITVCTRSGTYVQQEGWPNMVLSLSVKVVVSVVEQYTGPSQGLKIRGGTYYWLGIVCPPWLR
jgi:hypothetical protein